MHPIILDGSTGAMLAKKGMPSGICVEEWIINNPTAITSLQDEYISAGSDIVYAPTFGANEVVLARHGLADQAEHINAALSRLSMENAAGRALVFGDVSPTGELLYPMGEMSFDRLVGVYYRQAKAMEAYVDGFTCETFMSLAELRAAFLGVRTASDKPIYTTITVDGNGRTLCGDALLPSLITMQALGAAAFGVNCVSEFNALAPVIAQAVQYAAIPFIFKPNAGLPEIIDSEPHYSMTADEFAAYAEKMLACGVTIFGGCCGTTPEFIGRLSKLKNREIPHIEKYSQEICTTSRAAVDLDNVSVKNKTQVICDQSLADNLEDENPLIFVPDQEAAVYIHEYQMMFDGVPVFDGASPEAISAALRAYNGRALIYSALDLNSVETYGAIQLK